MKQFLKALVINMLLRFQLLLATIIAFLLSFVFGLPKWLFAAAFLLWLIYGIVVTLIMAGVIGSHSIPKEQPGVTLHPERNAKFREMYEKHDADEPKKD